ncbi:MAG: class I SAM-dependent methyltransferase [Methyloprofundus sp.]|nr:class I SAM-dependent methyltransferase [Methyloprofundus sp.]
MSQLSQINQYIQRPSQIEQSQRLFHGRGHAYEGLKHVTIDWLAPVILITLFEPESEAAIAELAEVLQGLLPECKSIQLQHRYQLKGPIDVIKGEAIAELAMTEGGLQFKLSLGKARNTGLFLDMQKGRAWVQAHSKNQRVLNLFSYTCGFSVAAIAGGARSVLNVDMSSAALSVGRENHRLNHQDLTAVRFEKLNIFNSFSRFKKRGPFDLLVCDPPTLQKGSVDIARDYPKILRRLDQFMAPESTLVLCLNAPELGEDFLLQHMQDLAPSYQLIAHIKPPEVYKEAEAKGLKVLCFRRNKD